ncbi:MAG: anti-sigma factor [Candidatus Woesearchaeota archaeon]
MRKLCLGIVIVLLLSFVSFATQVGYTAETRYAYNSSVSVKRDIVFSSNRYGIGYVKPYGGYGAQGASRGSFGMKGEEEGASNLPYNDWIPRGSDPSRISNYYASARGYHIVNKYVELSSADLSLVSRPQINGSPAGYARVVSIKPYQLGIPQGTVYFRTKDLPPLAPDYIYEAWLVDEDSGYSMSLGLFQPAGIGRVTSLEYSVITPLLPFDSMMVTVEPFPDNNPLPGFVILEGVLKEGTVGLP